ncbi:hypothetical protein [Umezawaea tangerina]|uniref:Excreted virulence factor EspC (Type VII ESX diderm) n=1 Tax=Umezawaea tangerina TaxID=84725 RepID=A0A2T0TD46_9PSEU|nr:hypothetical protein [Umezawaea tangerina]PRY43586.1 hypothetical protein CLV43_103333 [Umezawaea tangerina]
MNDVARRLGGGPQAPSAAGRIEVDSAWLELYAKRVEDAAEELSLARGELHDNPLRPQSFGEIGRGLRTAEAYGRASRLLNQQLDRACDVLKAAGKGLHDVAGHYGGTEDEAVRLIKNADRR